MLAFGVYAPLNISDYGGYVVQSLETIEVGIYVATNNQPVYTQAEAERACATMGFSNPQAEDAEAGLWLVDMPSEMCSAIASRLEADGFYESTLGDYRIEVELS